MHVSVLIRLHFPRITTHLLRLLRPDKRRRQTVGFNELHAWCVAEAEDDATAILLIGHASGFRIHSDDVLVFGPALDQALQGGCEVDSTVHINCSSSRVTHTRTRNGSLQLSDYPIPSPHFSHLHPSHSLHLATRGRKTLPHRLTPQRPRLLHWRGSRK